MAKGKGELSAAGSLIDLAQKINDAHTRAKRLADSALEKARECGELLIQAKEKCGHGEFGKWLAENCQVGDRQARKYMALARDWDAIANRNSDSVLTIDGALRLMRREPMPELSANHHVFGYSGDKLGIIIPIEWPYVYVGVTTRDGLEVGDEIDELRRGIQHTHAVSCLEQFGFSVDECEKWLTVPVVENDPWLRFAQAAHDYHFLHHSLMGRPPAGHTAESYLQSLADRRAAAKAKPRDDE